MIYTIPTYINKQYQILYLLQKYEKAYEDMVRLIRTKDIVDLNSPLSDSAKFYKKRTEELREILKSLQQQERMQ